MDDRPTLPPHEAIRAARRAAGLSLRELARRIEVSPATLSAVENGRTGLSVARLARLAEITAGAPARTGLPVRVRTGLGDRAGTLAALDAGAVGLVGEHTGALPAGSARAVGCSRALSGAIEAGGIDGRCDSRSGMPSMRSESLG
ncbi:helix-turn-helix domain-containing protein, partial [Nocardia farcinica]|uniref:helix-turn-helix domain-containing protein n=1 Tax=Nocardia farcinica TaxID=37329 RepID=UPI002455D02F